MKRKVIKYFLIIFPWLIPPSFCQTEGYKNNQEKIVQENLDFYNQRNLDGFMSSFSDSIALYNFGKSEAIAKGREAIRNLYKSLFDASPKLHSTILHRSIIGNKVIDHESIVGRKGSEVPIELVMIYEVSGDKIVRMTVIRE